MKLRQIQTVTLTILLILLPTVGHSHRAGMSPDGGTPIIVGDGSVHIISPGAPFDSPGSVGNNWNMTRPNEYHRSGSGKTGQYGKVSLIGRTGKDWSSFETIVPQLVNFNAEAKDICKVEVKIDDPKIPETVTILDEGGKKGMVVKSSIGLTGPYVPTAGGNELVRATTNRITEIDIYTDSSRKPIVKDKAFIEKNCPTKPYLGCGIAIEYK